MPLTLTLKTGDWVNIGKDGAVMLVAIQTDRGGQIKLRFDFPLELAIQRPGIPGVRPNQAAMRCVRALDLKRLEARD